MHAQYSCLCAGVAVHAQYSCLCAGVAVHAHCYCTVFTAGSKMCRAQGHGPLSLSTHQTPSSQDILTISGSLDGDLDAGGYSQAPGCSLRGVSGSRSSCTSSAYSTGDATQSPGAVQALFAIQLVHMLSQHCTSCGKVFKQISSLRSHAPRVHNADKHWSTCIFKD